jgi:phage FluMu gp28-like protein
MDKILLPYQDRWARDRAKVKIFEKSRRIGGTWGQAKEDVEDAIQGLYPAIWFSSADESAAKEYIIYCSMWARAFNVAAEELGVVLIDKERDIKALSIQFANGCRINALSSSPKAFRSKGGKVVLDEFAWHDDPKAMWAAARPVITWGYPLRILSTHNGQASLFNQFIERTRAGKLSWSLHTVTIHDAVREGLLDKIMGRATSDEERAAWIEEIHNDCVDEETWLQEYCCMPQDESSAFLPYDLITPCESEETLRPAGSHPLGDLYIGCDIGRKRDLFVIWTLEDIGGVLFTRNVVTLDRQPFRIMREELFAALAYPRVVRACIDSTGIGMQLAEEAQDYFGRARVEAVTFGAPVKSEMSHQMRGRFEDKRIVIPPDPVYRQSFHSVRKTTTSAGNIRFDSDRSEASGHADHYWACALAVHAASSPLIHAPLKIHNYMPTAGTTMLRGYPGA